MPQGLESTGSGSANVFNHMKAPERVGAITDMKPREAARVLEKAEPSKAAETLLGIRDERVAVDIFKKMAPTAAAGVIPEVGAIQPVANALGEMRAQQASRVLTELAGTRPILAASTLEAMSPETRANAVKALEPKVASDLLEQMRQPARSDIADRLKPAKTAELLAGAESPAKTAETLQHMKNTNASIDTFNKLDTITQAQVIAEIGAKPSALALNEMPSQQVSRLLTELAETRPELATRKLEAMNPEARAKAVKAMEPKVAANLLERARSKVAGDIAERLTTRKSAEILKEMHPPTQVDGIVKQVKADVAVRLTEELAQARSATAAQTEQSTALVHLLKSTPPEEVGSVTNHLSSEQLADALRKMESPQQAVKVLLNTNDREVAVAAFGRLEPAEAVRLIPEAGPKATALAFERLNPQQVAQNLGELSKTMPELADRTLGAMNQDAKIKVMDAMQPEVAAALWERMGTKAATTVAKEISIGKIARMVSFLKPERAAGILGHLDAKTLASLLVKMDKLGEKPISQSLSVVKKLKVGAGVLATTPIVTTIGLIPTVILDGPTNFFSLLAGGAVATAVAGNYYFRVRDRVTVPDKVPVIGGKSLAELPNTSQIVNQTLWALVATATEIAKRL